MSTDLVFFLHRLGVKIYRVSKASDFIELVDFNSLDANQLSEKLAEYSGKIFRLLVSDTICYLFHTIILLSADKVNRESVLAKIKSEIPENFESTQWDYKIISSTAESTEVVVFAPIAEFQNLITNLSSQLKISFEAIEPESITVTRHPNPIIGIMLKDDLGATDSQSLNISIITPTAKTSTRLPKFLIYIFLFILFILANYFLYRQYLSTTGASNISTSVTKPTSFISLTPSPIPTVSIPSLSNLNFAIQNGSGRSGYANTIATNFKESGMSNITVGNAPNNNYTNSSITFASQELLDKYSSQLISIFSVLSSNIKVDKTQSFDAILILGIN